MVLSRFSVLPIIRALPNGSTTLASRQTRIIAASHWHSSKARMTILQKYLSRTQAAALLDRCPKTLRSLQNKGLGPKVIMIGNRPAYPIAELEAWLAQNTFGGR